MPSLRRITLALFIVYLLYGLMITFFQRSMLFPRQYVQPLPNPGYGVAGIVKTYVESPQGRVEGWFLPGEGTGARATVIFAHGNGELIDYWPHEMEPYRKMGFNVLLPEYRGYGRSAGDPSQDAITEDFIKFYDWLIERDDVDKSRIIFHGRSLGGGAVGQLLVHRPAAALILQSTFTSVSSFASQFFLPAFLVSDPFDTLSVVASKDLPVLVMHGTRDSVVPFPHAEKLAAATGGRLIAYDCDHNDFPPDSDVYWKDISDFLRVID